MSKITLTDLVNLQNETTAVNAINGNNAALTTAIDNTLSRDGTSPNQMDATLDMNSHPIINLPVPSSNFEPLRVIDRTTLNGGGTITVSSLPTGGTTGQYLAKNTSTNFDVGWYTPAAASVQTTFDTLALAQASTLPLSVINMTIIRKQAGWPIANAPYVRGTISGPNAFQDALGNYWQVDTSAKELQAVWFWAGGGGDDTTPLTLLCAQGAGKILLLGSLAYNVTTTIPLVASNCTVKGDGKELCSITISGSNEVFNGIFSGFNIGNLTFEGINFVGNNIATFASTVGAISIGTDNLATPGDLGDITIRGCRFYNFKQNVWVSITNTTTATANYNTVRVTDCKWDSVLGNSRSYSDFNDGTSMLKIWGSTVASTGNIESVFIQRNKVDGSGVMNFCAIWANVGKWEVTDNIIKEVGYNNTGLPNSYDVLVYTPLGTNNGGGVFSRNICTNTIWGVGYVGPGCHLYCASVDPVIVSNNYFEGVTRTDSVSLRRACVSLNSCKRALITDNTFANFSVGVALSGAADQYFWNGVSLHLISNNVLGSGVGGSNGVNVSWLDSGTNAPYVAILNNLITTNGAATVKTPGTFGTIFESGTKP